MTELVFIIENGTLTKFEQDDYVKELYLPDAVKVVGCNSFEEALVGKVVLSDNVTTIEEEAFLNSESLTDIVIPESVTTIETLAFAGCTCLREIIIPESVTSIGDYAIGYRKCHLPYFDPICFDKPVTVYGKKGSEAERYCEKNYRSCVMIFKDIDKDNTE